MLQYVSITSDAKKMVHIMDYHVLTELMEALNFSKIFYEPV